MILTFFVKKKQKTKNNAGNNGVPDGNLLALVFVVEKGQNIDQATIPFYDLTFQRTKNLFKTSEYSMKHYVAFLYHPKALFLAKVSVVLFCFCFCFCCYDVLSLLQFESNDHIVVVVVQQMMENSVRSPLELWSSVDNGERFNRAIFPKGEQLQERVSVPHNQRIHGRIAMLHKQSC